MDYRPVNFAWAERKEIRWGLNYSRGIGKRPPPRQGRRPPGEDGGFRPRGGGGDNDRGGLSPNVADGTAATPGPDGGPGSGGGPGPGGRAGFGGGGGRGGGRGGGGGGGFQPPQPGRIQFALYHTVFFQDQMLVRPGGPLLDLLNGAAAGNSGGQPQQQIEAQAGYTMNGLGARLSANWLSGTTVQGADGSAGTLTFSDIATINVRLWANFGGMRTVVRQYPLLRGTRLTLSVNNLFDQRIEVRDAAGVTPTSYLPAYLDPSGRTVSLSIRKLFF